MRRCVENLVLREITHIFAVGIAIELVSPLAVFSDSEALARKTLVGICQALGELAEMAETADIRDVVVID